MSLTHAWPSTDRQVERQPWRCHVHAIGVATVLARRMIGAAVTDYRIRVEVTGAVGWIEARHVVPIADQVVAFRPARGGITLDAEAAR